MCLEHFEVQGFGVKVSDFASPDDDRQVVCCSCPYRLRLRSGAWEIKGCCRNIKLLVLDPVKGWDVN